MRLIILLFLFGLWPFSSFAEEYNSSARQETRLEVDEKAGEIRFIIEGKEQGVLNAEGFHVRGNVTYGGTIRDVGENTFDAHLANPGEVDDAQ